jgi:hypothetical protein
MSERMIDLDAERAERPAEQTIKIGGETFRARVSVRPEALVPWEDFYLSDDTSAAASIRVLDETILVFLVAEDHERYLALRQREEDALTVQDMTKLVQALLEASADRPTEAPTGSGTTDGSGAPSSTAESSSRVVVQSISPSGKDSTPPTPPSSETSSPKG